MKRYWVIQLLTLFIAIAWTATDPLFETLLASVRSSPTASASHVGWPRVVVVATLLSIAVGTIVVLFVGTLGRSKTNTNQRSLRSLLSITGVIALWFSLAAHHDAIAWQGKRIRFAFRVGELETIAAPLRVCWPERDGDLPALGPFMAYPFGRPSTLLLLQSPRVSSQSVYVSAIERCSSGAIKLQLTGSDGGDSNGGVWAEWHPPGSRPASFTGGLADPHRLQTATSIGHGWFLVRYIA